MKNDFVEIEWDDNMAFKTKTDNFEVIIDAHPDFGGKNKGPKPKPLILTALGGCTSMDVIAMLNKMRVKYDNFKVLVDGELTDEHPKYYKKIQVTYEINGNQISIDKVKNAVSLSEEKYCGVNFMLKKVSEITSVIKVNGEIV